MYSLNVPLPPSVDRLANRLHPRLTVFDSVRERHTLVLKRFGADVVGPPDGPPGHRETVLSELRADLRPLLAGTDPFEVRITGIDAFDHAAEGPDPVVYLVVESSDLQRLHARLCSAHDAVEGIEGESYVPHVTLARGGDVADADAIRETQIDEIAWEVDELHLWDPEFRETAGRISLPVR